jgi:hypothetical protein
MKNQKAKIFSLLFLICIFNFLFFIFNFSTAFAANSQVSNPNSQIFSVSPVIINVPLSPGKTYKHELFVHNLTNQPLPIRANLSDFESTGEEGGYTFPDIKTNPLLSWITLSDHEMILSPQEKKKILLTITTPQSIPLGGYHGMLFFEPVLTTQQDTTQVISRIGVLMLANVGVPDPHAKKAEIVTFSPDLLHKESSIPLLLRVKNVSLHYFTAKPILTISPLFPLSPSHTTSPIYLEEKIIFQGKIRRWEQALDTHVLTPNIYKAHMQVSTGNGQFVSTDKYFIVFPWDKALIVTTIIIVILILIRKRKRLKKALEALGGK